MTDETSAEPAYGECLAPVFDLIYGALTVDSPEIAFLANTVISAGERGNVIELGVGTGRVLAPLARSLESSHGVEFIGIENSQSMIDRCAVTCADTRVRTVHADFSDPAVLGDVPRGGACLVFCVCGTISMLPNREAQLSALQNTREMLTDDGIAILETHDGQVMRAAFGGETQRFRVPCADSRMELSCLSSIDGDVWRLQQTWRFGDERGALEELSLLTTVTELAALAQKAQLQTIKVVASLKGDAYVPGSSPQYVLVLARNREHGEK